MATADYQLEKQIQAKGLTAARVLPADVEAAIMYEAYFTPGDAIVRNSRDNEFYLHHKQVTICFMILQNGHRIIGVNTGPVSMENFDADLARELARKNATDQIWPLLGYELRTKLAGAGLRTVLTPT